MKTMKTKIIKINGARLKVAVAETTAQQSKGLMHIKVLPCDHGMLFQYPSEQKLSFWMKNTSIPLDIIFADEAGIITKIFENARPFTTTSIFGGNDVQYVLEINAGLTKSLGIKTGSLIEHSLVLPGD